MTGGASALRALDDGGVRHAARLAHRLRAKATADAFEVVRQGRRQAGAGRPRGCPRAIAPPRASSRSGAAPHPCCRIMGPGADVSLTTSVSRSSKARPDRIRAFPDLPDATAGDVVDQRGIEIIVLAQGAQDGGEQLGRVNARQRTARLSCAGRCPDHVHHHCAGHAALSVPCDDFSRKTTFYAGVNRTGIDLIPWMRCPASISGSPASKSGSVCSSSRNRRRNWVLASWLPRQ